ncbi:MAG: hypothetical protein ABIN37_01775, partial [Burkholderiaceae bacterium]
KYAHRRRSIEVLQRVREALQTPQNGSDTNIGLAAQQKSPRFNLNGPVGLKSDGLLVTGEESATHR